MKLTKHAEARKQQRGFSKFTLDIIQQYGRCEKAPGNATAVFFGNREHQNTVREFKRAIQLLDRAKGGKIIISGDSMITLSK